MITNIGFNIYTYLRNTGFLTNDQADQIAMHLNANFVKYLKEEDRNALVAMAKNFAMKTKPTPRQMVDIKRFSRNLLGHELSLQFAESLTELESLKEDVAVMERLVNTRGVHTRELAALRAKLELKQKEHNKLRAELGNEDDDE